MKALILAAGYATRLHPLTLTQPKPLLPVAGKPMIEHVLDKISTIGGIDRVYAVTNARFADHFQAWAGRYRTVRPGLDLQIINDQSTDESNKLGAIGDVHFVLTSENVKDDLIVVAGDNLFTESLQGFGRVIREKEAPVLGIYDVGSLDLVKKYSAIDVAPDGRLLSFEEKPPHPNDTFTGIALYYYPKSSLHLIRQYMAEGRNPDQPGRLMQWMCSRLPVYTWPVPGLWFDIGSRESLEEANAAFQVAARA